MTEKTCNTCAHCMRIGWHLQCTNNKRPRTLAKKYGYVPSSRRMRVHTHHSEPACSVYKPDKARINVTQISAETLALQEAALGKPE